MSDDPSAPLLDIASSILDPQPGQTLVLADAEHFNAELADDVHRRTGFDLLMPMLSQPAIAKHLKSTAAEQFRPRWAGYATTKLPYQWAKSPGSVDKEKGRTTCRVLPIRLR